MKTAELIDGGAGFVSAVPALPDLQDCTAPLWSRVWEFGIARNLRVVAARLRAQADRVLHRLTGRMSSPVSPAYGVQLTPNFGDKTFRYCRYGTYGHRLADYLAGQQRPFGFVDVGANQGLFSLIAARNPRCEAITAFEPVPSTFAYLEANVVLNGAQDRLRIVQAAIGEETGKCAIAVKAGHSGVSSMARADLRDHNATQQIAVLDGRAAAATIPAELRLIVKIDVEGHEETVIAQLLASACAPRIAAIFYEMDERWADAPAVRAMLERAGFDRFTRFGIGRHADILAERRAAMG